jgi:hypothetical protein
MCFLQVKFGGVFRGTFLGGEGKGLFFLVGTYFRRVLSFGESFGVYFGVWGGGGGEVGEGKLGGGGLLV